MASQRNGTKLAGTFVIGAAWSYDSAKARGLDGTVRALADTGAGPWLLGLAALGLIVFGLYGYAEAVWHKTQGQLCSGSSPVRVTCSAISRSLRCRCWLAARNWSKA